MKVICIDENAWPYNIPYEESNFLRTGKEYWVEKAVLEDGYVWYDLSGDPGNLYWERQFAQISDIDETELVNERELVNV
jgi:hypothetical protein